MDLTRHLVVSAKAALAASLAWLAVVPLGGLADEYPYYAPLGAVIAVTSTVAGSVRESLQGLVSILIGATLALVVQLTEVPTVLGIAFAVGLGSALAGWRRFGSMAPWIPTTALFVLIIGGGEAVDYATAYLGLISLGVVVGIALNIVFPPLALTPMADTAGRLRDLLADQLDDLADGLRKEGPLSMQEWRLRQRAIRPTTEQMQRVVGHATDSRRANWRAKRWSDHAEQGYQQARALQQVAFLIEDLTALVVDQERAEKESVALGPALRPPAAHALSCLAEVLRSVERDTADEQQLRAADDAVCGLVEEIRRERERSSHDLFAAGAVVTGARRAMASLVPGDLRPELPSDW